jgi:hypothetical protein
MSTLLTTPAAMPVNTGKMVLERATLPADSDE